MTNSYPLKSIGGALAALVLVVAVLVRGHTPAVAAAPVAQPAVPVQNAGTPAMTRVLVTGHRMSAAEKAAYDTQVRN